MMWPLDAENQHDSILSLEIATARGCRCSKWRRPIETLEEATNSEKNEYQGCNKLCSECCCQTPLYACCKVVQQ